MMIMSRSLFRAMKPDASGFPSCGPTARTLGVRVPNDIAPDENGCVHPGTGGMSVAPDDPLRLPPHRRPPILGGGYGKDPVWKLLDARLGENLRFRPDPREPDDHGFVEPWAAIQVDQYQLALCATAPNWTQT